MGSPDPAGAPVTTLSAEWKAAVDDSGMPSERCMLFPFPGPRPVEACAAYLLDLGSEAFHDESFPASDSQLDLANAHRDHHRVGIYADSPALLIAARLRHELEHACQVEAHGLGIFRLTRLVTAAIGAYMDRRRGGDVYNLLPVERDANAAASVFVRRRYPHEVEQAISSGDEHLGLMRWHLGPEPVEMLPARTVYFAAQFRDLAEQFAARKCRVDFADMLDEAWPGAGRIWKELV